MAAQPLPHRTPRTPTGRRLAVGLASTLLGWVLVAIGLGMGLPRLSDGVSAAGLLMAACLVAGLVLLVVAGRALWRATDGWARLVVVPWLVVVLVGTYALAIALAAAQPRHPALDAGAAADLPVEEVRMTSADGVHLAGWYLPSRTGAAVVLRHGSGSTRANTVAQARALAAAGYGVLLTDARGHGGSQGRAMDLGWYGDADIAAAVDLLAARPDVDPDRIAVVGMSMGGEEAIGAAGADPRIRAVVAEGATGRTAADKAWLSEEYGVAGVLQEQVDRLTYGLVGLLTPTGPPPTLADSVRSAATTPMLLIAAGQVPDEGLVAEQLRAVAPDRVEVWVVPGAGHVAALATEPTEWAQRVTGFLDSALADQG